MILEVMHGKPMDDLSNRIRPQESLKSYEKRINESLETSTIGVDLSTEILSVGLGTQRCMTIAELEKKLDVDKAEEKHGWSVVAFEGVEMDTSDGSPDFKALRLYVSRATVSSGSTA